MKKLLVVLSLAFVYCGVSHAAGATRGAKASYVLNYTTTVSSPSARSGPFAVYSVIISTGAAGDYAVIFDSNSVTGLTSTTISSVMKTRCYAGSTSSATQCNFDPPLQFNTGLEAVNSAVGLQTVIVYEAGRVTVGY